MPSIINGLFAGRSGIASHGTAIAVVGDNISNSSTIGFKASRAEFQDLIAGGQTAGKIVGSGSSTSGVSAIFDQGTLEFTSRPLDLAIDGNGFFVVSEGAQRYYTRAGNFKVNSAGYIVSQDDKTVLGFPAGGSGALEPLNINSVSQATVSTSQVAVSGNVNAASDVLPNGESDIPTVSAAGNATTSTTTYAQLSSAAKFSTVVQVFDTLGQAHTVTYFFFHIDNGLGSPQWRVNGYVNSDEVDTGTPATGLPRLIGSVDLEFDENGSRVSSTPAGGDIAATIPWTNGSSSTSSLAMSFERFTQYASPSNILSITQDGQGVGAVTNISIGKDGTISANLSNGQTANIGKVGLANFANPEGLVRIGNNLLQQSTSSGEPIVGEADSGTFGAIQSGSIELSTVDIANEFVKLITLQRGFQANSRIITTINQLLNEIIQLA